MSSIFKNLALWAHAQHSRLYSLYKFKESRVKTNPPLTHSIAFLEALASEISIIAFNISSFKFSLQFSGVELLEINSIDLWRDSILKSSSISIGKRWMRDLQYF